MGWEIIGMVIIMNHHLGGYYDHLGVNYHGNLGKY